MNKLYKYRALALAAAWAAVVVLNYLLLPARYAPHTRVEPIAAASLGLTVQAPAVLQAKKEITLKASFTGPVVSKNYHEGDEIRAGQLLLEIGRSLIQPEFQSKTNGFKNAQEDLRRAQREYALQKKLYKLQAVARSAVEAAGLSVGRSEQMVQAASSTYYSGLAQWNDNRVYAPFAGTVAKDSQRDESLATGGKELLTLADLSEYKLRAKVDELQVGDLRVGQEASAVVQAYPDRPLSAVVAEIGTQAEGPSMPQVPVTLRLKDTGGLRLLPNMSVDVRIQTGQTGAVLSVPLAALISRTSGWYVWTLTSSNRLELRTVTPGKTNSERVEIKSGLAPGDRVCTSPAPDWVAGMKVLVDG